MPSVQRITVITLLAASTACSPDARISFSTRVGGPLAGAALTVTVEDGARRWTWTGDDFRTRTSSGAPTSPSISTPTSGTAQVTFELRDGNAVISSGTVSIPLQGDWAWNLDLIASTDDPMLRCFGCQGSQAFPLAEAWRAEGQDSIWVVWGGNSISDPVVY
jgi:hypothetical protein